MQTCVQERLCKIVTYMQNNVAACPGSTPLSAVGCKQLLSPVILLVVVLFQTNPGYPLSLSGIHLHSLKSKLKSHLFSSAY